jgi:hypothetical protein
MVTGYPGPAPFSKWSARASCRWNCETALACRRARAACGLSDESRKVLAGRYLAVPMPK